MKKLFTLLLLFSVTAASYAQLPVKFGIRLGGNFATIGGEANQQLNSLLEWSNGMLTTSGRTGFHAGGFMQVPLTEYLVLEPGLSYSSKGYTLKGALDLKVLDMLGIAARAELQSHYVDMPIVLKATMENGIQLYAGPQLSYLVQADLRARAGVLGVNLLNQKWNVTDQFNRLDAAVTAGIGYQFESGMNINAGYDFGLSRIDAGKSVNARNQVIKVSLGYRF